MDKDKAHELTRDIMVAIITSDKPVARQGDYIAGVCNAYKMIFHHRTRSDVGSSLPLSQSQSNRHRL